MAGLCVLWWHAIVAYRTKHKKEAESPPPSSKHGLRAWINDGWIRCASIATVGTCVFGGYVVMKSSTPGGALHAPSHDATPRRPASSCPGRIFCVLVAPLAGQNGGVTESLYEQLYAATDRDPGIAIRSLDQPITPAQNSAVARSIGATRHADVVLWGWYDANVGGALGRIHVEVIARPKVVVASSYSTSLTVPVADINSFEQRIALSSANVTYLTLLIAGLRQYEAGDYQGAKTYLDTALAQPVAAHNGVNPAYVYLYRGNASMHAAHNAEDARQAIADFSRSIQLKATVEAYINRGYIYGYPLHQTMQGITDYTAALMLNHGSDRYAEAEIYDRRGTLHFFRHENLAARSDIDRSIRLNPYAADAYGNRADVEFALGHGPTDRAALTRSFQIAVISNLIVESCTTKILSHGRAYVERLFDEACVEGRHPSGRLKISPDGHVLSYVPPAITPIPVTVIPTPPSP